MRKVKKIIPQKHNKYKSPIQLFLDMPDVTIYTTTTCPWCHKTMDFLKANKVNFTEVNVQEHPDRAEEAIGKSGQMGVPVIDIDGQIIVGFNEPALKKALKLK